MNDMVKYMLIVLRDCPTGFQQLHILRPPAGLRAHTRAPGRRASVPQPSQQLDVQLALHLQIPDDEQR